MSRGHEFRVGLDPKSDVGKCLKFKDGDGPNVTSLPVVDNCTVEHTHEIFATPDVDSEDFPVYPGFKELEAVAQAACLAKFEGYVGVSPFESTLFYSWIVPSLESWNDEKDRQIICVAGKADSGFLTESVKDSQR